MVVTDCDSVLAGALALALFSTFIAGVERIGSVD
jgi:hypothetical protein